MRSYRRIPTLQWNMLPTCPGSKCRVWYKCDTWIHDTARLRGSSKWSGRKIKYGPGQKKRCISPATVDRPWNLTSWNTICIPYSLRPRRTGWTLHRSFDIQRQTTQKRWCPKTNYTEILMSRDKLHRNLDVPETNYTEVLMSSDKLHVSLDIQRKTKQKSWYPKKNYTETLMFRDKLHRSLDIKRKTKQKSWYPKTNYIETLMSRDKLHRILDVQRLTTIHHNPK